MATIKTDSFLSTLISTGPDASSNLFNLSIRPLDKAYSHTDRSVDSLLSLRVTQLGEIIRKDVTTIDLDYLNTSITKVSSGAEINKTQNITIRVDSHYHVLDELRQLQCIDDYGEFYEDNKKRVEIRLDAMVPRTDLYSSIELETAYRWIFKNCYITTISGLTYSYDGSTPLEVTVGFVWESCEEGTVDKFERDLLVTSSDVTNNIFSQSIKAVKSL